MSEPTHPYILPTQLPMLAILWSLVLVLLMFLNETMSWGTCFAVIVCSTSSPRMSPALDGEGQDSQNPVLLHSLTALRLVHHSVLSLGPEANSEGSQELILCLKLRMAPSLQLPLGNIENTANHCSCLHGYTTTRASNPNTVCCWPYHRQQHSTGPSFTEPVTGLTWDSPLWENHEVAQRAKTEDMPLTLMGCFVCWFGFLFFLASVDQLLL